jgi:hypothetical protein
MEKEFIPYEQALALKELGFDEPCFGKYDIYGSFDHKLFYHNHDSQTSLNCSAPLYQQAFRWFREKYNLHAKPIFWYEGNVIVYYIYIKGTKSNNDFEIKPYKVNVTSYEEAELECLKKLIEIVKEK